MSSDGSFPSRFRDSLRFGFPTSSWASSWSSAEAADGSSGFQREDGCSYTKVVKSKCFLEHSSDGTPVKKCEKTEQILRNCVGRPQEIIETKSESTEEEVPDGWTMEAFDDEKGIVPFSQEKFPGAPWKPFQGTDPFSRGLSDGIESFMQVAEEMMNDALNQFGFFKGDEGSDGARPRRLPKRNPSDRIIGEKGESSSHERTPHGKAGFKDSRSFDEV